MKNVTLAALIAFVFCLSAQAGVPEIIQLSKTAKTAMANAENAARRGDLYRYEERRFCMEEKGCVNPFYVRPALSVDELRGRLIEFDANYQLAAAMLAQVISEVEAYKRSGGFVPLRVSIDRVGEAVGELNSEYNGLHVPAAATRERVTAGQLTALIDDTSLFAYSIRDDILNTSEWGTIKNALAYLADDNLAANLARDQAAHERAQRAYQKAMDDMDRACRAHPTARGCI
ncbi:MAG: hypothetical protein HYT79_09200 [Elusimicrobia bacterium]|nr:hypothetical protein [Elusimicrobiota bacterium]